MVVGRQNGKRQVVYIVLTSLQAIASSEFYVQGLTRLTS